MLFWIAGKNIILVNNLIINLAQINLSQTQKNNINYLVKIIKNKKTSPNGTLGGENWVVGLIIWRNGVESERLKSSMTKI